MESETILIILLVMISLLLVVNLAMAFAFYRLAKKLRSFIEKAQGFTDGAVSIAKLASELTSSKGIGRAAKRVVRNFSQGAEGADSAKKE